MNAYRIPHHDGYLLAGSDCDNSAMDAAREAITDEQQREIVLSVADSFGGDDHREAMADQVATLADAHYMLDLMFKHDITIAQAMEMTKGNTHHIRSLRCLRNLTQQCARAVDGATTDKAREILDSRNGEEA